jgi:thermostable 8-oxoguanine DNA glycosylase
MSRPRSRRNRRRTIAISRHGVRHTGPSTTLTRTALDLASAWTTCAEVYCRVATPQFSAPTRAQFERELLFCLLGGFGISFELALSASTTLWELDPFAPRWEEAEILDRICFELSQRQFEPRNASGSLRRYRFPNRKAHLILAARRWLAVTGRVHQALTELELEQDRRRLLCNCPGIGPKSASWLLRNLGMATRLAILDVHLIRALQEAGKITTETLPRDYEAVEAVFLAWCDQLGAPPAAFDLFVWEWQRGTFLAEP